MRAAEPRVLVDPVGMLEIAQRMGVPRQTADNWRQRPTVDFPEPEPDLTIGGRPVWQWATVQEWADRTGRAVLG